MLDALPINKEREPESASAGGNRCRRGVYPEGLSATSCARGSLRFGVRSGFPYEAACACLRLTLCVSVLSVYLGVSFIECGSQCLR